MLFVLLQASKQYNIRPNSTFIAQGCTKSKLAQAISYINNFQVIFPLKIFINLITNKI